MNKKILKNKIQIYFWYYILRPLRRLYHLIIKHQYIAKNTRNQQIMDYCQKLIINNFYQPSNPVERWVDLQWEKEFNEKKQYYNVPENMTYESCRYLVALRVGCELQEYFFIKERT